MEIKSKQGAHKGRPYNCNVITDMAVRYAKCVHNDGWTFHPNPPQLSRIHPNLTGSYTVVGATLVVAQVFRCGCPQFLSHCVFQGLVTSTSRPSKSATFLVATDKS